MIEPGELNADFERRVVIDTKQLSYVAAPVPGVWRKRLELIGDRESGRVTSLVRYDPGSSFPGHDHPEGEEILVLSGEWCDERGSFSEGSYQLNPPGFRHAPFTRVGCTLFVKLKQYAGSGRETVLLDTRSGHWLSRGISGVTSLPLYYSAAYGEFVRLTRLEPGSVAPEVQLPTGEEIFVLEGAFEDEHGRYDQYTWLRMPSGFSHSPRSEQGCLMYVKSGGFPR